MSYYCYMAYLLALTVIQVLIILLYLQIRTIRDERGEILRILTYTSIVVLLVKYWVSPFEMHVNQLFTATSSLCLVSLSSLYLRNIVLEVRTSGYLILLAFFPFLLFYVFYVLLNIYSAQIQEGMIYDYLDFFNQRSRTILFTITLVYDVYLLWPLRKKISHLCNSIDGQLAVFLWASKVILFGFILFRGLIFERGLLLEFPDGIFTFFVLFIVVYFRYFNSIHLCLSYLFRTNAVIRIHETEYNQKKSEDLMFYVTAIDQLLDQEKLFKNPELKLEDLRKFLSLTDKDLKEINRKYWNYNFEEYLNTKRFHYFIDHLNIENEEPAEINKLIYESGFRNECEFNRAFYNEMGCTFWKYIENKSVTILHSRFS